MKGSKHAHLVLEFIQALVIGVRQRVHVNPVFEEIDGVGLHGPVEEGRQVGQGEVAVALANERRVLNPAHPRRVAARSPDVNLCPATAPAGAHFRLLFLMRLLEQVMQLFLRSGQLLVARSRQTQLFRRRFGRTGAVDVRHVPPPPVVLLQRRLRIGLANELAPVAETACSGRRLVADGRGDGDDHGAEDP